MPRSHLRAGGLLVAATSIVLGACSSEGVVLPDPAAGEVTTLSSQQGVELMRDDGILVIDVRPVDEYVTGHLVGAQNIDASDDDTWRFRTDVLDHDRPTVVYCSDAACSADAAQRLVDAGFSAVYDLGGMDAWDDEFLAVEEPRDHRPLDAGDHEG